MKPLSNPISLGIIPDEYSVLAVTQTDINWHNLNTDWPEIYRGYHRAVLPVGCSSFLLRLTEQNLREIITPNISDTTVASALNVDLCFGSTHILSFIQIISNNNQVKNQSSLGQNI